MYGMSTYKTGPFLRFLCRQNMPAPWFASGIWKIGFIDRWFSFNSIKYWQPPCLGLSLDNQCFKDLHCLMCWALGSSRNGQAAADSERYHGRRTCNTKKCLWTMRSLILMIDMYIHISYIYMHISILFDTSNYVSCTDYDIFIWQMYKPIINMLSFGLANHS